MAETRQQGQWSGEFEQIHRDGTVYPAYLSTNAIYDSQGEITHFIGVFSDITERKKSEQRLAFLAHYDVLTQLPNRELFRTITQQAINNTRRTGEVLALLFIDLDNFKDINDLYGHSAGDEVLKTIGQRIHKYMRDTDSSCRLTDVKEDTQSIARLGGDEFAVLATHITNETAAARLTERLMEILTHPIEQGGHQLEVTASIGIAIVPHDTDNYEELMQFADMAMYAAKQSGRNQWALYNKDMSESLHQRLQLIKELQIAIKEQQLELHYQPQYSADSSEILGMEALIRWRHPEKGMIPPFEFIPVAEECGLIVEIGAWVVSTACHQAKEWLKAGYPLRMSVNVSPNQLKEAEFIDHIEEALKASDFPPELLELEITENCLIDNLSQTAPILESLRSRKLRVAIDDFGTGYSSLSYLNNLPITTLKIDRAFINNIDEQGECAIVAAILSMANHFDLEVVAEGVETRSQLDYLKQHQCQIIQGYYFGKPVTAEEFKQLHLSKAAPHKLKPNRKPKAPTDL